MVQFLGNEANFWGTSVCQIFRRVVTGAKRIEQMMFDRHRDHHHLEKLPQRPLVDPRETHHRTRSAGLSVGLESEGDGAELQLGEDAIGE
jgi:hypothetical protein